MGKMHGLRCWLCGKHKMVGRQVSHSGVRTQRIFKPNLQWKRVLVDGKMMRMRMCTKCLKRMKKDAQEKVVKVPDVPKVSKVEGAQAENIAVG